MTGGIARLRGRNAIAGSTLTMDAAVRHAVAAGLSVVDVCKMAATTPARAVGLHDRGAIEVGRRADYLVLDADLQVLEVYKDGLRVPTGGR